MTSLASVPLGARKRWGRKERKRRSGGVRPNRPNSARRCIPVLRKGSRDYRGIIVLYPTSPISTLSPTKAQITEFFRPLVNSQINFGGFIENNYLEVDSNVEKLTRKYYDCTPQQLIEKYKTS